jgi:predicted nucleic acid-binding protein
LYVSKQATQAEALAAVRALCEVVPLQEDTHDLGMRMAGSYGLSIYDAMIAAAARLAGCKVLLSEDMQNGLDIEGVRVRDPFRSRP